MTRWGSNYITIEDIASHLAAQHPSLCWFRDEFPKVEIQGEEGQFGKITFQFSDATIDLNVFLKDKQRIKTMAEEAAKNYSEILDKLFWEMI